MLNLVAETPLAQTQKATMASTVVQTKVEEPTVELAIAIKVIQACLLIPFKGYMDKITAEIYACTATIDQKTPKDLEAQLADQALVTEKEFYKLIRHLEHKFGFLPWKHHAWGPMLGAKTYYEEFPKAAKKEKATRELAEEILALSNLEDAAIAAETKINIIDDTNLHKRAASTLRNVASKLTGGLVANADQKTLINTIKKYGGSLVDRRLANYGITLWPGKLLMFETTGRLNYAETYLANPDRTKEPILILTETSLTDERFNDVSQKATVLAGAMCRRHGKEPGLALLIINEAGKRTIIRDAEIQERLPDGRIIISRPELNYCPLVLK